MLRPDISTPNVYLCIEPIDMRKQIDGLAIVVAQAMDLDPLSESLFVFCNRQRDKLKILAWDKTGFVVYYKRLEKNRFKWPRPKSDEALHVTGKELNWLLEGFDLWRSPPHQSLKYERIG